MMAVKEATSDMRENKRGAIDHMAEKIDMITLFMCGDVMTGRGIDQVLPYPSDPRLYEPYMRSAKGYLQIAEKVNGPIQRPVDFSYIWGDALQEMEHVMPDLRVINLETAVTKSNDYWKGKGINYRMHPRNIPILTAARIDFCSLANNHILDWGYAGLMETVDTLNSTNIKYAGAGKNLTEANAPAVMEVKEKGRVIVFSFGTVTSGVPISWSASVDKPGVNLLKNLSDKTVRQIKESVQEIKQAKDIIVASIHWGGNWGFDVPDEQRIFAHNLIDSAGVDIIHGHSSHHIKGLEVYQGKVIIYGSGDFLNDYEGIKGYETFRGDLGLMYFVSVDPSTGMLLSLQMTPTQIKRFRINRASRANALWIMETLNREGKKFKTRVTIKQDNNLSLKWH